MEVDGGIVLDHQDLEGEALRHAIILQLMAELCLAVGLEYTARIQPLELKYQWTGRLFFS